MKRAQRERVRVCAYGDVLSVHLLRRVHGSCHCLDAKLPERKNEECERLQMESELKSTSTTIETFSLANSFLRLV